MPKLTDFWQLFVLALLCTMVMVFAAPAQTPPQQIKADPGTNNPPPAGPILDLSGTPIPNGGFATYQHYTKTFIAGITNTAITFAFRDDPAQISFANASVVDLTADNGINLLTNGDFSGGVYPNNGNNNTPVGWTYANMYGAQAGGGVISGSAYCYSIGDVAVNNCWFDGAVQAYDAISQTITTIVGHTYQISFDVAEDSATFAFAGNTCCGFPPNFPGSDCWAAAQSELGPPCNFHDISTNGDITDAAGNGINVTAYAQAGLPSESISVTHILQPGVQSIYTFPGKNDPYKITPSPYSMGGESLTITAVPIPQSSFIPPANFPNETCVPFADYSTGVDTCVEYQADCSAGTPPVPGGGDCNTLLYTLLESYDLPPDLPAIGGPDFLVVHGSGCPTSSTALAQSIFSDYFVTRIDPTTKGGGGGTGSCFEVTYTPGAPPITSGSTSSFVGFEFPVSNTRLNPVYIPLPVLLSWDYRNSSSGNPVTNLHLCNNTTGLGCTTPWVNLGAIPLTCPAGPATGPQVPISSLFNTGLLNFGKGEYSFVWNTAKGFSKGTCASVVLTFDSGLTEFPATFQFH